jgi:hypothetical protein
MGLMNYSGAQEGGIFTREKYILQSIFFNSSNT